MSWSIRTTTGADINMLLALSRKIFHKAFDHLNTPENMKEYMDRAFTAERLEAELKNSLSEFYFILSDEIPVGYLKINQGPAQTDIHDNASLEIERIYVDHDVQNMGLGAMLLDKAISRAQALGVEYVWLGVWEKNPKAIRFYERHGFQIFGKHSFRMGDELQTDLLMKKLMNSSTPFTP